MAYRNRFRSSSKCIFLIIFLPLIYSLYAVYFKLPTQIDLKRSRNFANVVVHIDFKGSPIKLSYLQRLLPTLRRLGVTGLLMEYEDMFPYEGNLVNLSASNCYNRDELHHFLGEAVDQGLDIIPLVQTFGHMEHALKLAEFAELRETEIFPDSLCPSAPESIDLVTNMLTQVIQFHADIFPLRYIHVGCDEVFHINECWRCKYRNLKRHEIFLSHMKVVTDIVHTLAPDSVALVWDDMFRGMPPNTLNTIDALGVELICWDYGTTISVSHVNLMKYHRRFENLWIASAFKGADGRLSTIPNMRKRLLNHYKWMRFINNYKFGGEDRVYQFSGIILTGWSRYSHMDPPCDLFQASLPSLFMNLLFIEWSSNNMDKLDNNISDIFMNHIYNDLIKELNCTNVIIMSDDFDYFDFSQCIYDGSDIYRVLIRCDKLISDMRSNVIYIEKGLLFANYYAKFKLTNRIVISEQYTWCNRTFNDLLIVEKGLSSTLRRYYSDAFVQEYLSFRLYEAKVVLIKLFDSLRNMLENDIWERRSVL